VANEAGKQYFIHIKDDYITPLKLPTFNKRFGLSLLSGGQACRHHLLIKLSSHGHTWNFISELVFSPI
jgi:hypothetical protein